MLCSCVFLDSLHVVSLAAEVFTLDYLLKMACAPFVRLEVVEPCVEYFDTHSWTYRPMSRWERFTHAFKESSNVIDLLAVLPWWCDLMPLWMHVPSFTVNMFNRML